MSEFTDNYRSFRGPLTVATIYKVIGNLWYAQEHPHKILARGSALEQLIQLWEKVGRSPYPMKIVGLEIQPDESVEDGVLLFVNARHPKSSKFNGRLEVVEGEFRCE